MDLWFWILLVLAAIFIVSCDYLRLQDKVRRVKSVRAPARKNRKAARQKDPDIGHQGPLHRTSDGHTGGHG